MNEIQHVIKKYILHVMVLICSWF